jgi:hypothetical protein
MLGARLANGDSRGGVNVALFGVGGEIVFKAGCASWQIGADFVPMGCKQP